MKNFKVIYLLPVLFFCSFPAFSQDQKEAIQSEEKEEVEIVQEEQSFQEEQKSNEEVISQKQQQPQEHPQEKKVTQITEVPLTNEFQMEEIGPQDFEMPRVSVKSSGTVSKSGSSIFLGAKAGLDRLSSTGYGVSMGGLIQIPDFKLVDTQDVGASSIHEIGASGIIGLENKDDDKIFPKAEAHYRYSWNGDVDSFISDSQLSASVSAFVDLSADRNMNLDQVGRGKFMVGGQVQTGARNFRARAHGAYEMAVTAATERDRSVSYFFPSLGGSGGFGFGICPLSSTKHELCIDLDAEGRVALIDVYGKASAGVHYGYKFSDDRRDIIKRIEIKTGASVEGQVDFVDAHGGAHLQLIGIEVK